MEKLQPKLRFLEFEGEWEDTFLDSIGEYIGGGTPKTSIQEYWQGEIPWISSSDIIENDIHNINIQKYITEDAVINSATKKIPARSLIIVSRVGVGKFAINSSEVCTSQDFTNIIIDKDLYNPNFAAFNLYKNIEVLFNISQGTSIKGFTITELKKTKLPFPTLPEQTKIASFLTTVDEKISGLKKQLTLLERYKKGVMQMIFSQELRFKDEYGNDFPDWEEKKLGEVCNIKRGASPRPITDKKWFDNNSNIGWVRISDISKSNKYLEKTEQYFSPSAIEKSRFVKKGNMIMSICATLGKPIYTNIDVCIPDSFVVFEKLSLENEYFFYYLDFIQLNWYKYGQPGTQVNLNSEIVSNETIPVPCNFEQQKIALFLSSIDEKIEKCQGQIQSMEKWKKGLLQQMFV